MSINPVSHIHSVPLSEELAGHKQSTAGTVSMFSKVDLHEHVPGLVSYFVLEPLQLKQSFKVPPLQLSQGSTQG